MKNIIKFLLIFINVSCASTLKLRTKHCNENKLFKQVFFHNVHVVQSYSEPHSLETDSLISTSDFLKSLNFISMYCQVISRDKILGYVVAYPNVEDFERDKNRWLEWYQNNKCNNIQLK